MSDAACTCSPTKSYVDGNCARHGHAATSTRRNPFAADPVWVAFDCGHKAFIERAEYGDGSAFCGGCGEIQTYARCLTCGSLDCQAHEGPTVAHREVTS